MGDLCDQADIERFLRSPEGRQEVTVIWRTLIDRKVANVHFTNQVNYVGIGIELDDGNIFACEIPGLDIEALRVRFGNVLDREYDKDYPERKES